MNKRNDSVVRATSYLLIYFTAIQPLHPAMAAGITPDNNQTQVQNQNNIPVVNIATPNGAGISHNTYQEFNVAPQGAVLNNATQAAQSQLAGQLNANPNLKEKPAELIINEVTGSGRSDLQGQLEIVGNKANVMIANPNGITCDGCGFINTSGATLTTGKPLFDKQGALEALEVKQGQITIGDKGLDGKATDYVDIISRATELNGKIQANTLSLTQGANRINLKDGTVKLVAGEGAKPQLAVDTKALGGMYANKIRLVATEDGVGVNLKELTSNQRDITLNANGKIELGNIQAKTDLNILGKETHIAQNTKVQAGQDITLANTTLDNKGRVAAGRDMRVFGDTVRNTGDKALLQANDNMWIQKDAQGNKGQLVENRSATIKTVKGDLVIRTKELNNTRNIFVMQNKQVTPDFTDRDMTIFSDISIFDSPYSLTAELTPLPDKWFGHVYFSGIGLGKDGTGKAYLNNSRIKSRVLENSPPGLIFSGRNAYINSNNLSNRISRIEAKKDIFLAGNKLINESKRKGSLNDFIIYDLKLEPMPTVYPYKKSGETKTWHDEENVLEPASVIAKGSIVADFKDSININTELPYDIKTVSEVNVKERPETLSAENILLHAGKINITDKIKAMNTLDIISEQDINLNDASLLSSNHLSMTAINHIHALQSEVKGKDITLISRHGDIRFQSSEKPGYFNADNTRRISTLGAKGNLTIYTGKNLLLHNTYLTPGTHISLTANNDIEIENNGRLSPRQTGPMHPDPWDNNLLNAILPEQEKADFQSLLPMTGVLTAAESLIIHAGGHFFTQGAFISAGKEVYLTAAKHIELSSRELMFHRLGKLFLSGNYIPPLRSMELGSRITAKNHISIMSGGDINGKAVQIQANGNTLLSAGNHITLPFLIYGYSPIQYGDDNDKDNLHFTAQIRGDKKLTIAANGAITTMGSKLTSGGGCHTFLGWQYALRISAKSHLSGKWP
nr:filamentous hemagglutinin N-terminal domain-containing protein [Photorhabdus cinerea]